MISRTACVPRMKALLPLYSQVPKTRLWPGLVSSIARTSSCPGTEPDIAKLPKMPVPRLCQTMTKYIRTLEPLLNSSVLGHSRHVAQLFCDREGNVLQEMLEDRAACLANWLEDLWLETAYLGYRDSVVINSSPSLMMPMQNFRDESERLIYTSKLISGALQFHRRIYRHEIPQQIAGNAPQDMTQFYRIMGTFRTPCLPMDAITYADPANLPKHIVVVCNCNYFKLPVMDARNNPIPEEEILFMLRNVVDNSCEPGPGVGILTALDRDSWATAYRLLRCPTLQDNVCSLREIETSLFLVCLDNPGPESDVDRRTAACLQLLHGNGSNVNSANRWFDKTVQFIIGAEGAVGLCYEHTPAEAIPISMMVDHILKYIESSETKMLTEVECPRPIPLPFEVDDPLTCEIIKACKQMNTLISDLDLVVISFEDYGKDVPKKFKMSPDSFIQMAMQLAFYRLHGKPAPTYESGSLRMFYGGRTETIRSCSRESKAFCVAMLDQYATTRDKVLLLREAVTAHKDYTNEAMRGCGIDRHLLGLKLMADQRFPGKQLEFFNDYGYLYSKRFLISSSQVPAADNCVMSYGPSDNHGYGVCYNPLPRKIMVAITSKHCSPTTSSAKYAKCLRQSLCDMRAILLADAAMKSKL